MNASLLYPHNQRNPRTLCSHADDLVQDLNLDAIFSAMAQGDDAIDQAARFVMLEKPCAAKDVIHYRQAVMQDALLHSDVVHQLYEVAKSAVTEYVAYAQAGAPSFARILPSVQKASLSIGLMNILLRHIGTLSGLIAQHGSKMQSEGMQSLFRDFASYFSVAFQKEARNQLAELACISDGCLVEMSAKIGLGLKSNAFIVRGVSLPLSKKLKKERNAYEFEFTNINLLSKADTLRGQGLLKIHRILLSVNEQILAFFKHLQFEMGFYKGCAQLHGCLLDIGMPIAFPTPLDTELHDLFFNDLVDISMGLVHKRKPVANTLDARDKKLILATGANQGGKSTFLRSVGCAQIMMQCGMFVSAAAYSANLCSGLFTHFSREEDERMHHGKLDEELFRMKQMIDDMQSRAMVLMNESFSSTSEQEASAIAQQIVSALIHLDMKVLYVTHLYDYAHAVYEKNDPHCLCLVADRDAEGNRSFVVRVGEPAHTSFGQDLYTSIISR